MDRNNALASLDAAQREVASHISKARDNTRGLPHGASGLDSTKRCVGHAVQKVGIGVRVTLTGRVTNRVRVRVTVVRHTVNHTTSMRQLSA